MLYINDDNNSWPDERAYKVQLVQHIQDNLQCQVPAV